MKNPAAFFSAIRAPLFGGRMMQAQVSGTEAIIAEGERRSVSAFHVAYMLATAYLETAKTMQAISERGAVSYFDKYEPTTKIGKTLGNTLKGDGYKFRGRGLVQITGRGNYVLASKKLNVDFVANPDKALDPKYAIPIMFCGMIEGWFTGKKLSDYINGEKVDYVNARRVVNGTDKAAMIAGYARIFEQALTAGGYGASTRPDSLFSVIVDFIRRLIGAFRK